MITAIKFKAFSIVELITTVAILAALAAVALPMYNRYLIKSEFTEMLVLMNGFKSEVTTYYNKHGEFPPAVWGTTDGTDKALTDFSRADSFRYETNTTRTVPAAWWGFRLSNYGPDADLFMCLRPNATTGLLEVFCGPWRATTDPEAQEVAEYLPANCRDPIAIECYD